MLSEYEKKRLEKIKRNQEKLKDLKLPIIRKSEKENIRQKQRSIKKRKINNEESIPIRRSLRSRGLDPEGKQVDKNNKKIDYSSTLSIKIWEPPEPQRKPETELFKDILMISNDDDMDEEYKKLEKCLDDIYVNKEKKNKKLLYDFGNFELIMPRSGVKSTPEKTYFTKFVHSDRLLVVTGDKKGHLGIVDCGTINNLNEEFDAYTFSLHDNATSWMDSSKFAPSKLYTTSYDGTVRLFDIEKRKSSIVMETDPDLYKLCLTTVSIRKDSQNEMYVSNNRGGVYMCDARLKTSMAEARDLHEKKIGCVDAHPLETYYFLTSSNDRTVKLWDWRKTSKQAIQTFKHERAITSAFFNSNGSKFLTTCFDDCLRIFNASSNNKFDEKPQIISHYNQTGRWIQVFKAVWSSTDDVCIGNMGRRLDLYKHDEILTGGEISLATDYLTAIPAVNGFHPTLPAIASSTGSGYVYLWITD